MGRLQLLSASFRVRGSQRVKKRNDTIKLVDEKCDGPKVYRSSLRRLGDVVSVHQSADVQYGKCVHILSIGEFIEGAGYLFDAYLKSYFRKAYPPVQNGDLFRVWGGMRSGNFKVIRTDLPEHCVIAPATEIFCEVQPLKRVRQLTLRHEAGYVDVGGTCKQMVQIQELVEHTYIHPQSFQLIGIKPPEGILFHGPRGSGKALIVRAVANETVAFFLCINGPKILSKMAGESESKLRKTFLGAEKIDSIGIDKANGDVDNRIVSQLMPLIDGHKSCAGVTVMGTANCPYSVDPALERFGRFVSEIHICVPDEVGCRLEVLRRHTKNLKLAQDVDLEAIFEEIHGHVGADLAALCTEAALQGIIEKVVELPNVSCEDLGGLANVKTELQEDKRGKDTIFLSSETCDLPKVDGSNLRVRLGDVVSVLQCADVKYGKRVHIISISSKHLSDIFCEVEPMKRGHKEDRLDEVGSCDGGVRKQMALIREFVVPRKHHLFQSIGVNPPKGILFFGPHGSGKALIARAVANETFAGKSESNLRKAFEGAEMNTPSIFFIDDIDSIAPLPPMDWLRSRAHVFVMGTTKRPNIIVSALRRFGRFDMGNNIGIPDKVGWLEVLRRHNMKFAEDVDLETIFKETHGYVGSDLAALCTEVPLQCIREKRKGIDLEDESINADMLNNFGHKQPVSICERHFRMKGRSFYGCVAHGCRPCVNGCVQGGMVRMRFFSTSLRPVHEEYNEQVLISNNQILARPSHRLYLNCLTSYKPVFSPYYQFSVAF